MEPMTSNGGGCGRGATAFNWWQYSKDTESSCVEKKAVSNGRHGGRNRDIFTSCPIPSHMAMVSQIHLYRLQPLVFLQSCHSDLRDGLEGGGVQHESVCTTTIRSYCHQECTPGVGYCLRKSGLRKLRMKWWHFKTKPTIYERNHKGG